MGFYLRKSVRIGPLKFNLSQSGIGVSTGIPGIRVGIGPRGNYVHVGRGGLYYRQTLSNHVSRRSDKNDSPVANPNRHSRKHGPMQVIGSTSVSEMVDTDSASLLAEIERKQKVIAFWPFVLIASILIAAWFVWLKLAVWMTTSIVILLCVGIVAAFQNDKMRRTVVLIYDLDEDCHRAYQKLFAAVETLADCGAVWQVTTQGKVYDRKYHAGAGHLITRHRLDIGVRNPPCVKTNVSVPFLGFHQTQFYLFPDRILEFASSGIGSISYKSLNVESHSIRFIEDGVVPRDAVVVDHTWQFVNKDGGPDLRFRDNPQLPVCNYEEMHFSTSNGINQVMQISRLGVSSIFSSAILGTVASLQQGDAVFEHQNSPPSLQDQKSVAPTATPSFAGPTNVEDLRVVMIDMLCCMAFADGGMSERESIVIRNIMGKLHSGWSAEDFYRQFEEFGSDVVRFGYEAVLERSISRLTPFKKTAHKHVLMKSLQCIATADAQLSKSERDVYRRVRDALA